MYGGFRREHITTAFNTDDKTLMVAGIIKKRIEKTIKIILLYYSQFNAKKGIARGSSINDLNTKFFNLFQQQLKL